MFYQPKQVAEMWDTWLYYHEGKHYLYYLHKSDQMKWDGMSLAVSTDGVHYQEMGPIIHKREDAVWLGTGSTWKTADGFALNFSESRNGVQNIFFARSDDLIHWQILGDEYRSVPDPRWYDETPTGRWDCIWTMPRPGGGFYGYLTARPWNKIRGMRFESVGRVESDDGLHWRACPPPVIDWGGWPVMNLGEVGAIEQVQGRYYLMLGYNEQGLGGRQVSGDMVLDMTFAGGMYLFTSSAPEGPFTPAKNAYRLLVSNGTYFSRFYRTPQELLVNHHSFEKDPGGGRSAGKQIWMAPLKSTIIDAAGDLRLGYWQGNEACKGSCTREDFLESVRIFPQTEIENHGVEARRLQIDEPVRGAIYRMKSELDLESGTVIEGEVAIYPSEQRWGGLGLYLELAQDPDTAIGFMLETRGKTEFADLKGLQRGSFFPRQRVMTGIASGKKQHLRILLRRTMLEVYLDDLLVQCYSLHAKPSGRWGLTCESGTAVFEDFAVWTMSL